MNEEFVRNTRFVKWFILTIFSLVFCTFAFSGICCVSGGIRIAQGFREGRVQTLTHRGLHWKTWEGELVMPGINVPGGENSTVSNVFRFSVLDDEVRSQVEALHGNDTVRLYYEELASCPPWKGESGHIVTRVEKVR